MVSFTGRKYYDTILEQADQSLHATAQDRLSVDLLWKDPGHREIPAVQPLSSGGSRALSVYKYICVFFLELSFFVNIYSVQFLLSPVGGEGQSCSQACCKHCRAVARLSGSRSNMVKRKSLN